LNVVKFEENIHEIPGAENISPPKTYLEAKKINK